MSEVWDMNDRRIFESLEIDDNGISFSESEEEPQKKNASRIYSESLASGLIGSNRKLC